ncbi:MAG TPA: ABC transporter permease, partial [Gemmataceae bacterium]|nr:ABC transporter permease [Gemmataceae bacterium]
FAALLIAQQLAIFCGLLLRTVSTILDVADVDIWVMNADNQFIDEMKAISDDDLYRIRGVPGVEWAVPFYKGQGRVKLDAGNPKGAGLYQQVVVLGLDDATLVGAPREMVVGTLADLRIPDAVVMDENGFKYLWPKEPLHAGKVFEMNDHRAVVVGICKASETFQTFPILYTRYNQAVQFIPQPRQIMSAVFVHPAPGQDAQEVCRRIEAQVNFHSDHPGDPRPRLKALTREDWMWLTLHYFMAHTGVVINFSITVSLGFIVGCAIAGQTFYTFTLENLNQFGSLKAMGVSNLRIAGMVLIQALVVGLIGYCLGVGLAALFGETVPHFSKLAFYMPWQVLLGTAGAVGLIVVLSSLLSIRKVLFLEPAVVFRG